MGFLGDVFQNWQIFRFKRQYFQIKQEIILKKHHFLESRKFKAKVDKNESVAITLLMFAQKESIRRQYLKSGNFQRGVCYRMDGHD